MTVANIIFQKRERFKIRKGQMMEKEKQIDDMTKDLCHTETCEIKKCGIPCNHRCKAHIYATRAIDKGYAKASEVAREIIADLENILEVDKYGEAKFDIRELHKIEKKYTGEVK